MSRRIVRSFPFNSNARFSTLSCRRSHNSSIKTYLRSNAFTYLTPFGLQPYFHTLTGQVLSEQKKFLENFSNFFENKKRPHNPLGNYTIFLFHYLLVKAFQLIFLCNAYVGLFRIALRVSKDKSCIFANHASFVYLTFYPMNCLFSFSILTFYGLRVQIKLNSKATENL